MQERRGEERESVSVDRLGFTVQKNRTRTREESFISTNWNCSEYESYLEESLDFLSSLLKI